MCELGTLITSGFFSIKKPRLGLSLSIGSISTIFSVQNFNNSATRNSCRHFRPPNPRKDCKLFPLLQTHIDILHVLWVSHILQLGPSYDKRHAPPRISFCRISVFHQTSHGSLETTSSSLFLFDSRTLVHVQDNSGDSPFHVFISFRFLMTQLYSSVSYH